MYNNDLTNREFGDYHLLRKIGGGAMAEVYLAEQRSLGRRVAVKILKPELAHDETYIKRFVREAKAIAALNHPNLVQIFQTDCFEGYWFIAQEYVQGQTLQELIRREGALSFQRAADILWNIASALEKAAQTGIVHRDIKPDNILLGDNGDVKVTDFGLARVGDSGGTATAATALTQIGMTLGTPLYMSPEQAQGKLLDHRSDLYSLGITIYHALAGQPPFRGDTALSVALQHVNQQPELLEKLRPDIPPPLARIVHRMIEKLPEKRFQSFYDVQLELRELYTVYLNDKEAAVRLGGWDRFFIGRTDQRLLATTEKLQRILQKEDQLKKRQHRFRYFWLLIFPMVFLIGLTLGFFRVYSMPNPLEKPVSTRITKRNTVSEQWVYACILNTTDAWQSILDYFPEEEYFWGRKAKRQLIRCYFHEGTQGDTVHSLPIFQEFADFSDIEIEDQVLGLAGLAWCSAENQDNMETAKEYLRRLYELNFSYSDPLLIQILDAAHKTIQRKEINLNETENNNGNGNENGMSDPM
ncbi:MAG: serine/threonine protein kinase [Planctomycetaceae bacterium]|jgi:serine/threonine-protein kinase|nr:serine/threonine protein kinase [Planctomycetaceae bacterium]